MADPRTSVGRRGERRAARHHRRRGLRLVARNARTPSGELDLICLDGETLVFVEVRTVASPDGPDRAVDAVTPSKARQVIRAARTWLTTPAARPHEDRDIRFDAIGIDERTGEIEHIPDAFRVDDAAGRGGDWSP